MYKHLLYNIKVILDINLSDRYKPTTIIIYIATLNNKKKTMWGVGVDVQSFPPRDQS